MMLSIQAARMGSVSTTLRRIGCCTASSSRCWNSNLAPTSTFRSTSPLSNNNTMRKDEDNANLKNNKLNNIQRSKSSSAAALDDHDDESNYGGLAAIAIEKAMQRTLDDAGQSSLKEAWMVNLGRKDDNAWLMGPREKEWFTGVPPSKCPGRWCRSRKLNRETYRAIDHRR